MKYLQTIANIRTHYDDILQHIEEPPKGYTLDIWGIEPNEKESIVEEREVLQYLIGCRLGFVHERNTKKPSLEAVQRCFNRHLSYLQKIHGCDASNVNKHSCKLSQKAYKACRYYLFKFSLPAWYAKLPDEVLTIQNKYER
ncbi:hypothetical protein NDS46_31740 (plasmid) [Paenibacillus thiaminolyticus]|uniref:hypothetical protein n=1 Tax=Paenibacillus thiaminolyticus TaxID=49283 RepID=UPI00232DE926|nr:hypothetical protein [Paenibacillus thiaminolyticus]WCF11772.1 hypothetical protein NDS46_31740 [Paenibacillus thiaminolyticus]